MKASVRLLFIALAVSVSAIASAAPVLLSSVTVDPGGSASATSQFDLGGTGPRDTGLLTVSSTGFSGSARSVADFGVLKNFATATLTNYSAGSYGMSRDAARASSIVSDSVMITGGTGIGYLKLVFDITGSTSLSGDLGLLDGAIAQGQLSIYAKPFPGSGTPVNSWGFTGPTTLTSSLIEFTYGTPFDLTLSSSVFISPADTGIGYTYDLTGTADFGSTIDLSELFVYGDAAGTQQQNFTVSAASGTDYPEAAAGPTAVPEPGSLSLLAGALGLLGFARRRKSVTPKHAAARARTPVFA